jgi:D-aminopeptidase
MSPLFQAVAEATEEAVYNAMLQAVTTTGYLGHRLEALPFETVRDSIGHHGLATKSH